MFPLPPKHQGIDNFLWTAGYQGKTEFEDDVTKFGRHTPDVTGSMGNVRRISVTSIDEEIRKEQSRAVSDD